MTYKIQIDDTVRPANESEVSELIAKADREQQAADNRQAARDSAIAKLKSLGLNDAEISALVG